MENSGTGNSGARNVEERDSKTGNETEFHTDATLNEVLMKTIGLNDASLSFVRMKDPDNNITEKNIVKTFMKNEIIEIINGFISIYYTRTLLNEFGGIKSEYLFNEMDRYSYNISNVGSIPMLLDITKETDLGAFIKKMLYDVPKKLSEDKPEFLNKNIPLQDYFNSSQILQNYAIESIKKSENIRYEDAYERYKNILGKDSVKTLEEKYISVADILNRNMKNEYLGKVYYFFSLWRESSKEAINYVRDNIENQVRKYAFYMIKDFASLIYNLRDMHLDEKKKAVQKLWPI